MHLRLRLGDIALLKAASHLRPHLPRQVVMPVEDVALAMHPLAFFGEDDFGARIFFYLGTRRWECSEQAARDGKRNCQITVHRRLPLLNCKRSKMPPGTSRGGSQNDRIGIDADGAIPGVG